MKRILLALALLANALNAFAQAPEYLPEWKEGYLDIHTIATGRGDAALIVMPDGTSMMIDAGDYTFKVHSTTMQPQGSRVGLNIVPFNIHIMKPMQEEN